MKLNIRETYSLSYFAIIKKSVCFLLLSFFFAGMIFPVKAESSGEPAIGRYIWVANSASNTVSKVDTFTDSVAATIDVGTYPVAVAVAQEYVYVANRESKSISKINIDTDIVEVTIDLDRYPLGLALGADEYIYAIVSQTNIRKTGSNMAYLYRIDPATNLKTNELQIRRVSNLQIGIGINSDNIAFIPTDYSWAVTTSITTVDLNTFTKLGEYGIYYWREGYLGPGIAIDKDGNAWASAMRGVGQQSIVRLTPSGQKSVFRGEGAWGELVVDPDDNLWATNYQNQFIKFNMSDHSYIGYSLDDYRPRLEQKGMTFLNCYLWLVDPSTDSIRKIDPADGTEVDSITVGDYPISVGDMSGYEALQLGFISGSSSSQCSFDLAGVDATINPLPLSGQGVTITGLVETVTTTPIEWQLSIDGRIIQEGSGNNVQASWDGRDASGEVVPGTYEIMLSATTDNGPCCTTKTLPVTIEWNDQCKLDVRFSIPQ